MSSKFEGIVLFRRNYRDQDGLVKIFTLEYGTKMFFVRGLFKTNAKLASACLPVTYQSYVGTIQVEGLSFIQEATMINMFRKVQEDPLIQAYAAYIVQLIDAATPDNVVHDYNYALLKIALEKLDDLLSPELIATYVELMLLSEFGTYIDWHHCAVCGDQVGPFDVSINQQGVICRKHLAEDPYRLHVDPNAVYVIQQLIKQPLQGIQSINLSEELIQQIRRIMTIMYQEFVGIRLKSKSYLDQMLDQLSAFTSHARRIKNDQPIDK